MTENEDRRSQQRIQCDVPTLIRRVDDKFIYSASIKNYDPGGLYLETDRTLDIGAEIFLGLDGNLGENTPPRLYRAKIIWMRRFESAQFRYGYGAMDITAAQPNGADELGDGKTSVELRKHERRSYFQPVIFIKGGERIHGSIRNISLGGFFIEVRQTFFPGQTAHFIIPDKSKDTNLQLKCEVVHQSRTGIGVRLKKIVKNT